MKNPFNIKKLNKSFPLLTLGFIASSVLVSGSVFAQVDASELSELRAQIAALSSRLEQLENENVEMSTTIEESKTTIANVSSSSASSWADKISISGDLRPRHEVIDDESKPEDRNRSRVRARIAIAAEVNDDWTATFGLASGGDDPISTNQTLGDGNSTKDIRLDYAYTTYSGIENTKILAGKYKNVFFKAGGQNLIFDGDLRPEGVALKYENNNMFFNAGTFLIESDNKAGSQDKESMWGAQLGYDLALDGGTSLTLGGSYYNAAVKGSSTFYGSTPTKPKSFSNTLDSSGAYLYDYEEAELFLEANTTVGGQKLRVFADYVTNLDADMFDTGWVVGAKLGSASSTGGWEAGYSYQDLEADAVFGAFTDSDFANSGTDGKGHVIKGAYGIAENTKVGFTYFINEYGEATGTEVDYKRLMLDLSLSF